MELLVVFLDDRKHDLFVRVISLDDIPTLKITVSSLLLLTALPSRNNSQNHPSESPVPLSSLPRGPKEHKRKHSAAHANPPPKLNPESTVLHGPNPSRDLIDPPEIGMHDVPTWPRHRPRRGLRDKVSEGESEGEKEREETQGDETGVQVGGEEG